MKKIEDKVLNEHGEPICCVEPWPYQPWAELSTWYCQSCGKYLTSQADRINRVERVEVVEGDKTPTLESFDP